MFARPVALAGSMLVLAGALLVWKNSSPTTGGHGAAPVVSAKPTKSERRGGDVERTVQPPVADAIVQEERPVSPPRVPIAPPSEASRRMIHAVWDRGSAVGALTPEQAALWRQNLDAIIKAGGGSVAAIAEFLATNHDTVFDPEASELLGFSSAREALLDALTRIGGSEAIAVMADVLGSTANPAEVAMLARNLDILAPEVYRQQAVSAARESLAAAVREPVAGVDVAPLFEVLLQFGGVEAAADLERAATRWGHYATLALGAMPEGGGVPSLLRIADAGPDRAPNSARLQALQVIAQLAPSNEQARGALVAFARDGRIPAPIWPYLARPLAGEQARLQNPLLDSGTVVTDDSHAGTVHIVSGNQNLIWVRAEAGLSPEEQARLATLVRELVAVTKDPDGLRILRQTQARLEQEAARVSSTPRSD